MQAKFAFLRARIIAVLLLFLGSSCVIQHARTHPVKIATTGSPASKLARHVTASVLDVRSAPSANAPVVAQLAKGSMFNVVISGEWAKLGENQWVLAKFLK